MNFKKQWIRKMVPLLLVVCLTGSSCQRPVSDANVNAVKETKVLEKENGLKLKFLQNYGTSVVGYYSITNEKTQKPEYYLNIYENDFNSSRMIPVLNAGTFGVDRNGMIWLMTFQKTGRKMIQYDFSGNTLGETAVDDRKAGTGDNWYYADRLIFSEDLIYTVYSDGIQIIGRDGKAVNEIECSRISAAEVDQNGDLYILFYDSKTRGDYLTKVDSRNGDMLWKKDGFYRDLCLVGRDELAVVNDYGIQYYQCSDGEGGRAPVDLREYEIGLMTASDYLIDSCLSTGDDTMYLLAQKDNGKSLVAYKMQRVYGDEAAELNAKAEREKSNREIIIDFLIPYYNPDIKDAITLYQNINKKIRINATGYAETVKSVQDQVQELSLMVMSGLPWDLLWNSGLPLDTYIRKELLADIRSIDKKSELRDKELYFSNLMDVCENEGKLFYIPTNISVPVMGIPRGSNYRPEKEDWNGFSAYIQENNGTLAMNRLDAYVFSVFMSSQNNLFDYENRTIDKKVFRDYMETCARLGDQKYFNEKDYQLFLRPELIKIPPN
ncbi:MAG TPA: hypothetical protein DD727_01750, partial [Clostridiales bacterium]|nr:hypothetical protein [Clostridiales bacterium]